jgi:hypothetical protein
MFLCTQTASFYVNTKQAFLFKKYRVRIRIQNYKSFTSAFHFKNGFASKSGFSDLNWNENHILKRFVVLQIVNEEN